MLYAVRYEKTFSNKREEHQYQKALSRRLLSHGLQREYGVALESLALSTGPHGKPYFVDFPVQFSVSHCPGLVCCGLSPFALGVDAEALRPYDDRLARRVCTAEEYAALLAAPDKDTELTRLWTVKESLMKLSGLGFSLGFQRVVPAAFPDVKLKTFDDLPGYLVTVSCKGELPAGINSLSLS